VSFWVRVPHQVPQLSQRSGSWIAAALIGDAAIHDHVIMSHALPQIKPTG